jgi:hypothetical protein
MSIKVTCPNGHELKVKNNLAGKTGLCPFCKGQVYVYVPIPDENKAVSEDAILDYLGSSQSVPVSTSSSGINLEQADLPRPNRGHPDTPWKNCVKCNRDIPSRTHICPFCHTYIAGITDF